MERLRIFAGPNGSGKTTLYQQLKNQVNCGHYLNPDDLYKSISNSRLLDLNTYSITPAQSEWESFWSTHGLCQKASLLHGSLLQNNILVFKNKPESYEAAILCDFLRHQLLKTHKNFSFETVFSHPSKLSFMEQSEQYGYKCYLYFSALSSPDISVDRVHQRKLEGGHNVPEEKIRSRYVLTLANLLPAMRLAYRAYIFDNSQTMNLIAEMTPAKKLHLTTERVPVWFEENILNKL